MVSHWRAFWYCSYFALSQEHTHTHKSRVSCQKGPTRHTDAWQIGPFWQDTLDISYITHWVVLLEVSICPERTQAWLPRHRSHCCSSAGSRHTKSAKTHVYRWFHMRSSTTKEEFSKRVFDWLMAVQSWLMLPLIQDQCLFRDLINAIIFSYKMYMNIHVYMITTAQYQCQIKWFLCS